MESSVPPSAAHEAVRGRDRRAFWLTSALLTPALLIYVLRGVLRVTGAPFLALAASVPDDTFYYLLPALNFRDTHTFTFDRLHPTYGFQPLWEIVLVLLAYVVPDRETFLRAVLVLCYVLRAATAMVLAATAQNLCASRSAAARSLCGLMAAMVFLVNEPYAAIATGGKEGALYGLLFAGALWLCTRPATSPGARRVLFHAALGAVLGGMLLARITPASVLMALTLVAWRVRYNARPYALAAGFVIPVGVWCSYALAAFGTPFPTSGAVKLQTSVGALSALEPAAIPQAVLAGVGPYMTEVLQLSVGLSSRFWGGTPSVAQKVLAGWCLLSFLAAVFSPAVRQRAQPVLLLLAVALVGVALVPLLLFGYGIELYDFGWYVNEPPLLMALVAAVALPVALRGPWLACVSVAVAVLFSLRAWTAVGAPPIIHPGSLPAAVIEASRFATRQLGVNRETRLAAFGSGLLGYLLPSHVINLDGLANDDRFQAKKQGLSDLRYLRRERVEYVVVNLDPPRSWFTAVGDVMGEFPARVRSRDEKLVVLRLDPARPCHEGFQHAGPCDVVYGWAWDCARPDDRVELEILNGEKVIARTRADLFEPHLRRAGISDGQHGFQVDLELPRDGSVHSITVRATGSGLALYGAPMSFSCSR